MAGLRGRLFAGALFAGALFTGELLHGQDQQTVSQSSGGADPVRNRPSYQINYVDDTTHVVHFDLQEADDEESVIAFLLLELVEQGII